MWPEDSFVEEIVFVSLGHLRKLLFQMVDRVSGIGLLRVGAAATAMITSTSNHSEMIYKHEPTLYIPLQP